MGVSVRQFVQKLTDTGIMTLDELESVRETLPAAADDGFQLGAQSLANELVRLKKLTDYQAKQLVDDEHGVVQLGSYLILDEIGSGGMGRVYKAQHRRMKRVVALKVLSQSATASPESVRRFQREVEAAARLTHPNIVTAYDADEENGIHYLVMEHVDGNSLATIAASRKIAVDEALDYVLQTARGLSYAHQQGVVHRDIKPANLLLDAAGVVKILDMGLARMEQGPGKIADAGELKLTQAGQIMGTIDFMSPEQAEDTRQADARSDIYSLGCTLYFLLAGVAPYRGETIMKKLLAHRTAPIPSLLDKRRDVPRELDAIWRRMAAKAPQDRYESMAHVVLALEAMKDSLPARGGSGILRRGTGSGILSRRGAFEPPPKSGPSDGDSNVLSMAGMEGGQGSSSANDELMLQEDADRLAAGASKSGSRDDAPAEKIVHAACGCGRRLALKSSLAGKKVKCPQCGGAVAVPAANAEDSQDRASETIEVACQCGARFAAKARLAGKTVKCPKCASALKIPAEGNAPSADKVEVGCRCGKRFKANAALAGKTVKCPACSQPIAIP